MAAGLRDQLMGAWKLISYEERRVDGSPSFYPMSEKPMGIIMYTPDGFMSAQLMKPDRKPFASGDRFKGTDEEYKQEASTYIAYSGPFHVDEEQKTLTHSIGEPGFQKYHPQLNRSVGVARTNRRRGFDFFPSARRTSFMKRSPAQHWPCSWLWMPANPSPARC